MNFQNSVRLFQKYKGWQNSINGLPRVKVELPQTFIKDIQLNFKTHFPFIKIVKPRVEKIEVAQHDTVVLKPVTVTKPDTIDVSIEDYKVPRFVMNTVNAPILSYTLQYFKYY